jgi:hypothetical protein
MRSAKRNKVEFSPVEDAVNVPAITPGREASGFPYGYSLEPA